MNERGQVQSVTFDVRRRLLRAAAWYESARTTFEVLRLLDEETMLTASKAAAPTPRSFPAPASRLTRAAPSFARRGRVLDTRASAHDSGRPRPPRRRAVGPDRHRRARRRSHRRRSRALRRVLVGVALAHGGDADPGRGRPVLAAPPAHARRRARRVPRPPGRARRGTPPSAAARRSRATPRAVRDVAVEDVRVTTTPAGRPRIPRPRLRARPPPPAERRRPLHRRPAADVVRDGPDRRAGTRIRYSVVFSNEDGGTPADRLLATWGRLTDIEYVLGVELDREGRVLEATYQGQGPQDPPLSRARGRAPSRPLGRHRQQHAERPRRHAAGVRAGARCPFDLASTSREAVMDAQPVDVPGQLAGGAARRARATRRPPRGRTASPTRGASSTSRPARRRATRRSRSGGRRRRRRPAAGRSPTPAGRSTGSSGRASEFPNGCFRGAVALPTDAAGAPLRALRFRAYTRRPRKGEAPLPAGAGQATARPRQSRLPPRPRLPARPRPVHLEGHAAARRGRAAGRDRRRAQRAAPLKCPARV